MNAVFALVVLITIGWLFWRATRYFWLRIYYQWRGVVDVDAKAANALIAEEGVFLLDVRQPEEYAAGHIAGAKLIPLGELLTRRDEIESAKPAKLLIVCRGGVRSAKACLLLGAAGFTSPLNLAGGVHAWQKAGLPYVKPDAV